ncbi:MAG: PucR family transcriptional regulator [Streptosporangiales bacterium]|nr:PucR family transcriptional regulator [Streptosporangiales bacterium]
MSSLAEHLLPRVPELADTLVLMLQEHNPGYRTANVVPAADLWRSCHDNIERILQLLADPDRDPREPAEYYDAARATGRRRAEQRMPLDDVLRSYRLGGRLLWEAMIAQAREERSVDTDGLLDAATRLWEVADTTSAQMAAAYHATERRLARVGDQHRAALWEGLLHGRASEPGFAPAAARVIGVPLEGRYLVAVADVPPGEQPSTAPLERRLVTSGICSAWQVRAGSMVGLLALGRADAATATAALQEVLREPAGLSLVVDGLAEVAAGYRQATLARRTLPDRSSGERNAVAALEERLPEGLLLGSPELAERLVRRWLGPLLETPAAERRQLLDTLEAWVGTAGSIARTAELTHCHRNTVLNRLRRINAITGRDVTGSAAYLEVGLALRAAHLRLPPH